MKLLAKVKCTKVSIEKNERKINFIVKSIDILLHTESKILEVYYLKILITIKN